MDQGIIASLKKKQTKITDLKFGKNEVYMNLDIKQTLLQIKGIIEDIKDIIYMKEDIWNAICDTTLQIGEQFGSDCDRCYYTNPSDEEPLPFIKRQIP